MSLTPSFESQPDSIESPLELESLFSHPEGLLTARSLAARLIQVYKRSEKERQQNQGRTCSPASSQTFNLNPEMPSALKVLLAFREPQLPKTSASGSNNAMGVYDNNHEASDKCHVKISRSLPSEPLGLQLQYSSNDSSYLEQPSQPSQTDTHSASLRSPLLNLPQQSIRSDHDSLFHNNMEMQHKLPPLSQLEGPSNIRRPLPSLSSNLSNETRNVLPTIRSGSITSKPSVHPSQPRGTTYLSSLSGKNGPASPTQSSLMQSAGSFNRRPSQPNLMPKDDNPRSLSVTYSPIRSHPNFNWQPTDNTIHTFNNSSNSSPHSQSNASNRSWTPIQSRAPNFSSPATIKTTTSSTMKISNNKRKYDFHDKPSTKKQKTDKVAKPKKVKQPRVEKKDPAKYKIDSAIWMRILEFTPPSFLGKARLISKDFKGFVDQFTSIYVNCRKENFGYDMPPPPAGLTERQYSNLLGSKGCLSPGCDDKNASRTHWSWAKRWCMKCWKSKIEREDRVIKSRTNQFGRTTLDKMLECIPVGMHDSFMKPHDIMDAVEPRGRNAPRLYKYYLTEDIDRIITDYEALTPAPYVEDPSHTAEQKATALANHQALMDGLEEKRTAFFAERKAKNDEHMDQVKKIESGIRLRREINSVPYDTNRKARKELFTKRAEEDIGHIPTEFVQKTKAFKAATRIFRDGGTERGWQTLKPKIVQEWEDSNSGRGNTTEPIDVASPLTVTDNDDNDDEDNDMDDSIPMDVDDIREESRSQDQAQSQSHIQNHIHSHNQDQVRSQFQSQTPTQHGLTNHGFSSHEIRLQQLQNALRLTQTQQGQQGLASRSATNNVFASMRSNLGMGYGMTPNNIRVILQNSPRGDSMGRSSMSNLPPNLGAQNTHPSINMLFSNPPTDHRHSYGSTTQQGFMNTNRNALNHTQSMNSNTKMSISSLIQQPARNPYSDFDHPE